MLGSKVQQPNSSPGDGSEEQFVTTGLGVGVGAAVGVGVGGGVGVGAPGGVGGPEEGGGELGHASLLGWFVTLVGLEPSASMT